MCEHHKPEDTFDLQKKGRADNLIRTWCGAATQCDGIILIPPHIAVYII
jgi:hypothetical protein